MRIFPSLILAGILLMLAGSAHAERDYVAIEKRLTAEQFKATGLDQLSAEQLKLLNSLLSEEQQTVVRAAQAESGKRASGGLFGNGDAEPVVSALKGEFRGWSKGTILTLENGQRWRVTEGDYYVGKPIPASQVRVTPGKVSGWYLQVEGHNPRAKVQRMD